MAVHDTQHDHLITNQGEVQAVGKSWNQSATFVAVNLRKAEGKSTHSAQDFVEGARNSRPSPRLRSSYHRSASSSSRSA